MRMVHEVSKLMGVSKRTLQYYDKIGLLSPTEHTESGYRLYDDEAVEKLWRILLFQELGYKLNDIKKILYDPDFDIRESIGKQIKVLTNKKERLENLIGYARAIKMTGIAPFKLEAYGDITFDEFIEDSKTAWNINMLVGEKVEGINNPFDYEFIKMYQLLIEEHLNQPGKTRNEDEMHIITEKILSILDYDKLLACLECMDEFTNLIDNDVNSKEVQEHVKEFHNYLNNLFGCSIPLNAISMYGQVFASGGDIGMSITESLGEKTTDFLAKAIQVYCDRFIEEHK